MSYILRRLTLSRLLMLCATIALTAAAASAAALALSSGPVAPKKPLAEAIHDALTAPPVQGITAHVQFVNHLFAGSSLLAGGSGSPNGGGPLLEGASGRVWISGGEARLELQSQRGATQLIYDGHTITLYDAAKGTLYRYTPPSRESTGSHASTGTHTVPSVQQINEDISKLMGAANISGATPTDVAGQPAYSVTISPKRNGGLLGAAELAFDATHGVPLRFSLYAKGQAEPVLELTATEVSYGAIPQSTFTITPPSNVKTTEVKPARHSGSSTAPHHGLEARLTGLSAVSAAVPFKLQAPSSLAGMARHQVRLVQYNGHDAAMLSYGEGLGGIMVIEAAAKEGSSHHSAGGEGGGLQLPSVTIGSAKGTLLPTALGSILSFQSGGVEHVLAGSVTSHVIEAAARGL